MNALKTAGHATPRIDALLRVTGRAKYTGDVYLPNMLYARVLRSPHPHARIKSINVAKAQALPGVKYILTRDNCDTIWASGDSRNKRYLFNNPVRFAGDAVAAVAAVDRYTAEEAMRLIEVDYETLPFVLEAEDALKPGAPEIQPGGNISPNQRGDHAPDVLRRGDVEAGFKAADRVFEGAFSSPHINNAQLEPRVSIATWEKDKLVLHASTQGIGNCRTDMAKDLGIAPENVQVICDFMGGGFGNKNQNHDFDLMAAILSKRTGVPVRVEFTRKDDFIGVHGRWPTKQYYKVGVKNDGTLTAIQMRGFSGMGPHRKSQGDIAGIESYQCPNIERTTTPVYTNMAVSANLRGPAYPQGVFGIEGMMDEAAYALGIDPVEFRLKNYSRKANDERPYTSNGLEECIRKGAEVFGWKQRWHKPGEPVMVGGNGRARGVGMGIGVFSSGLGRSGAKLELRAGGQYTLYVGVTDIGTGAKTTMGLIAAEELGVPLSQVRVVSGDTDTCPFSVGESGSRTTVQTGSAVVDVCKDIKKQVADKGAPTGNAVYRSETLANPAAIAGGASRNSFVAHFAEVEVDTDTGRAIVTKYVAAHDSGRIINPLTAQSQVQGGSMMGIGMALHEELKYDKRTGLPINAGFYGARIMTHLDAPNIEVTFVETEDAYGPFGAKTIGELTIIPSPACVANAIYDAIGVRFRDLPITREKILAGLAAQKGRTA